MPTCESESHIVKPKIIPALKEILLELIEDRVGKEIDTTTLSIITGVKSQRLSSWAKKGLLTGYKISTGGASFKPRFTPDAVIKAICIALQIKKSGNNGKVTWAITRDDLTGNDWLNCENATAVTEAILTNLPTLSSLQKQSGRGRHH